MYHCRTAIIVGVSSTSFLGNPTLKTLETSSNLGQAGMGTLVPLQANIVNAQCSKPGGDHMCVLFPAGAVAGIVVMCQGWSEATGQCMFFYRQG